MHYTVTLAVGADPRGCARAMGNFRFTLTQTDQFLPCGDPLPPRGKAATRPACARTAEEVSSDPFHAPVTLRPTHPGWAPLPPHRRESARDAVARGYDIGPDPVYFGTKPTAEPRPEHLGDAWFPEGRGKAGRKFVSAPVVASAAEDPVAGPEPGRGEARPGEAPAAGIGSEHLRRTRNQTRTGLRLTRDCWGRVIP